uniref:Fatty acid desaturase domain-containing protein n=1 Tax=Polytomella parva TaxID=51329 RepID=A0A7S0V2X9_9CHLO|mmetsp:Transcript_26637/g.48902  ORF Transcript_26637/g.48902 Transcript_26637/m.48902 type:complete len:435 (+) Transcript_26637:37-1341(+)
MSLLRQHTIPQRAGASRPCLRANSLLPAAKPVVSLRTKPVCAVKRDVTSKAAEAAVSPAPAACESTGPTISKSAWAQMSYSQQYDELFKYPLNTKKVVPKPSKEAQLNEAGAGSIMFSDFGTTAKRPFFLQREWNPYDKQVLGFIGSMHILALFAPFTFSWGMVKLFLIMYFITGCLGITFSYHRMLSHRSFQLPKWLEYPLAYCGVLAVQGDPMEWSSSHRYHHLHTDTPLDPHSPYEGFWWCHMGWIFDNDATLQRVSNRKNVEDLSSQPFYRWIRETYAWHVALPLIVLFLFGGFPALVWGGALRLCWVWHITWLVNSASHCWGYQDYNTGDLSRNNWWVGILGYGEGWHNNHHAFEFSARHGLEWWQIDMTWMLVSTLQKLGLATNVKLPTERQLARLAIKPRKAPVGAAAKDAREISEEEVTKTNIGNS